MIVLGAMMPLWLVLRAGLIAKGHSGQWAWLVVVPPLLWSTGTIAYWQVFFSSREAAQLLGMVDSAVPMLQPASAWAFWLSFFLGAAVVGLKITQPNRSR